jgi:hypothetical protein
VVYVRKAVRPSCNALVLSSTILSCFRSLALRKKVAFFSTLTFCDQGL